jgi:hypothetical protein
LEKFLAEHTKTGRLSYIEFRQKNEITKLIVKRYEQLFCSEELATVKAITAVDPHLNLDISFFGIKL